MIDTESLKKKIIDLAIQGKLTKQLQSEGDAESLYAQMIDSKNKLITEGVLNIDKTLLEVGFEEWPFVIPSNWKWVRFNDIFDISGGSQPPKAMFINEKKEGYVRLYQIRDYGDKPVPVYVPCDSVTKFSKEGDVLLARYGGSLGKVFFAYNGAYNVALAKVIPLFDESLFCNRFFYYYFNSPLYQSFIRAQSNTRSAQSGFNRGDLNGLLIPLPPLREQERIADMIDEINPLLDCIDEYQQQYEYNLSVLKGKIIDAGIQGKLTKQFSDDGNADDLFNQIQSEKVKLVKEKIIKKEKALPEISADEVPFELPQSWKWVRLGDICSKISSGNTPAGGAKGGAYVDEGYCFFREQNIYNDGIHEEGMVYISEELLNSRPNSTVLPKDILLNITGGSIGRCALVPEDFTKGSINQHILIIRTIDPRIRLYVHKCLCSPYYQKLIMGNVVGDKDGFSAGRCKNTLIPLPPISEQERIVERIDSMLATIE